MTPREHYDQAVLALAKAEDSDQWTPPAMAAWASIASAHLDAARTLLLIAEAERPKNPQVMIR